MATFLVRCADIGHEQRHGKQRRDLARVIAERLPGAVVELAPGRLVVETASEAAAELVALPGVLSVSPCRRVTPDQLEAAAVSLARESLTSDRTFAVRVRRRDGSELRSPDIARSLANSIGAATGARADLTRPNVTIGVELRDHEAFVFDRVIEGVDRTGPPAPLAAGDPRFLVDQMLGRLAPRLRLLGYDVRTVHDLPDSEVARLAAAEGRILLTQDTALSRVQSVPAVHIIARKPTEQLAEVLAELELVPDPARLFTRCTLCNALVEPVAEAAIADRLPPGVRDRGHAFFRCPACAQVYWRGSHVERILAELAAAGVAV
jgi:uncharacterized protein with PIN domain/tRNA(Ser,Leu) C12 N-acetylase TAN1